MYISKDVPHDVICRFRPFANPSLRTCPANLQPPGLGGSAGTPRPNPGRFPQHGRRVRFYGRSDAISPCVILTAFASSEAEIRVKMNRAERGESTPSAGAAVPRPQRTCVAGLLRQPAEPDGEEAVVDDVTAFRPVEQLAIHQVLEAADDRGRRAEPVLQEKPPARRRRRDAFGGHRAQHRAGGFALAPQEFFGFSESDFPKYMLRCESGSLEPRSAPPYAAAPAAAGSRREKRRSETP